MKYGPQIGNNSFISTFPQTSIGSGNSFGGWGGGKEKENYAQPFVANFPTNFRHLFPSFIECDEGGATQDHTECAETKGATEHPQTHGKGSYNNILSRWGSHSDLENLGKWKDIFQLGSFEQTGKVGKSHKYTVKVREFRTNDNYYF